MLKEFLVVSLIVVLLFGLIFCITGVPWDVCVYRPSEIAGVRVVHTDGLFSSSGPEFEILYNGNRRVSGKACVARVCVSEQQYNMVAETR